MQVDVTGADCVVTLILMCGNAARRTNPRRYCAMIMHFCLRIQPQLDVLQHVNVFTRLKHSRWSLFALRRRQRLSARPPPPRGQLCARRSAPWPGTMRSALSLRTARTACRCSFVATLLLDNHAAVLRPALPDLPACTRSVVMWSHVSESGIFVALSRILVTTA